MASQNPHLDCCSNRFNVLNQHEKLHENPYEISQ